MPHATPLLEMSGVSKRFGRVTALDGVHLIVRPGTVHAVLGENGAGKTTLMHVAYGMVRPDTGHVRAAGRELRSASPLDAIGAGIGMVHQHFTLVPVMTVAENLALGGHGRLRPYEMAAHVRRIAERTGFALNPNVRAELLSVGGQQRVEIAKALSRDTTVLILDEPTAVLAPSEIDDLLRWLRVYVANGNSAVFITHKLREALAVADDVTVLRQGKVVFVGAARSTSAESLMVAMVGTADLDEIEASNPSSTVRTSTPMFSAEHVGISDPSGRMRVRDATFDLHGGELVCIAAIEGSGQRELLRALAGRRAISAGTLKRPDVVGFVPEDRHHDALLLDRSLAENIALRGAGARRGLLKWKDVRARTAALVHAYDIRTESIQMPVRALSGGNQQKLVLAREFEATLDQPIPRALVVENPTRGLDVRATGVVHERLRHACLRGSSVVVYSSDLDEVLALASRVLVMFEGIVRDTPVNRDAIGGAMLGLLPSS